MKPILIIINLFLAINAFCQSGNSGNGLTGGAANPIFLLQEMMDKVEGGDPQKNYTEITGSPYWVDKWSKGSLIAVNGQTLKDVLIRYNLLEKRIELKDNERILKPGVPIMEFTLETTEMAQNDTDGAIQAKKLVFRTGFLKNSSTFYHVIYDGKNKILENKDKRIEEIVPYGQAPGKKIVEEVSYYLYKLNGQVIKIKRTNGSILKALSDKKSEIALFISTNKLKVDNDNDLIKVMKYYDSITST